MNLTEHQILNIINGNAFNHQGLLDPNIKQKVETVKKTENRYPLTDIGYDENQNLYVEIALAGFNKENIQITKSDNKLVITGLYENNNDIIDIIYTQQMISHRDFERTIILNEIYVNSKIIASMEDGILSIIIAPSTPITNNIEIQ